LRQAIYEFNQPMAEEQVRVLITRINAAARAIETVANQAKLSQQ
jgi:hypothetical protein